MQFNYSRSSVVGSFQMTRISNVAIGAILRRSKLSAIAINKIAFLHFLVKCAVELLPFARTSNHRYGNWLT